MIVAKGIRATRHQTDNLQHHWGQLLRDTHGIQLHVQTADGIEQFQEAIGAAVPPAA